MPPSSGSMPLSTAPTTCAAPAEPRLPEAHAAAAGAVPMPAVAVAAPPPTAVALPVEGVAGNTACAARDV